MDMCTGTWICAGPHGDASSAGPHVHVCLQCMVRAWVRVCTKVLSVHGYGFDVVHVYVGAWVGVGASTPCAQCRGYGRRACYSVWYVHGYGHVQ